MNKKTLIILAICIASIGILAYIIYRNTEVTVKITNINVGGKRIK